MDCLHLPYRPKLCRRLTQVNLRVCLQQLSYAFNVCEMTVDLNRKGKLSAPQPENVGCCGSHKPMFPACSCMMSRHLQAPLGSHLECLTLGSAHERGSTATVEFAYVTFTITLYLTHHLAV